MKKYIALVILLLPLSAWLYLEWRFHKAYSHQIAESSNGEMLVSVFLNSKELASSNPNSKAGRQQAVKDLLIQNKGNWELAFAAYKPHLTLRSEGLNMSIEKSGHIILNIRVFESQWFQYGTKKPQSSYEECLRLAQ